MFGDSDACLLAGILKVNTQRKGSAMHNELLIFGAGMLGVALIASLVVALFTMERFSAAATRRRGKLSRAAGPSLRVRVPLIDRVIRRVKPGVQQLDAKTEVKMQHVMSPQALRTAAIEKDAASPNRMVKMAEGAASRATEVLLARALRKLMPATSSWRPQGPHR
jgi:hypothetical protein